MGTEVFARGDEHLLSTEIGYLTGGGAAPRTFVWRMHSEVGARRVHDADGAQDAYGRDYSVAEFEAMLRAQDRQVPWSYAEWANRAGLRGNEQP